MLGCLQRAASAEAIDQLGEFHQVGDTHQRTRIPHDDLGIWGDQIRPLLGKRAHRVLIDREQHAHTVPVASLAHADERLASEGMKRMRYAHKARRWDRTACILN